MPEGYVRTKSATGPAGVEIDDHILTAVNRYALKTMTAEEVFAFRVVMCDNEVDRDREAFSKDTLEALAPMFVGKTVLTDHNRMAGNQCARICDVTLKEHDKLTSYGDPYCTLEATCYAPRIDDTRDLIGLIETGILKEVSLCCAVKKNLCSICGAEYWRAGCEHQLGAVYDNKPCYISLKGAVDAYELSFVAVPAQISAGVTKGSGRTGSPPLEFREMVGAIKGLRADMRQLGKAALNQSTEQTQCEKAPDFDEVEALLLSSKKLIEQTGGTTV